MCLQKCANCKTSLPSNYSLCEAELWVYRGWIRNDNSNGSLAAFWEHLRQHLGPTLSTALWSGSSCGAWTLFIESIVPFLSDTPHMCSSIEQEVPIPLRWKWCCQHPSSEGTCFVSDGDELHQLSWSPSPDTDKPAAINPLSHC